MSEEQKVLQSFYKTIGRELDELVVIRKDGLSLNGKFSPDQLRLITLAYEAYLSAKLSHPAHAMN